MAKVIWAPSALYDIETITEYIAWDSQDQAAFFVTRLIEAVDRLREFPLSGRVIPEIGNLSCREIIFGSFWIMYKVEMEDVWITGVVHVARD